MAMAIGANLEGAQNLLAIGQDTWRLQRFDSVGTGQTPTLQ